MKSNIYLNTPKCFESCGIFADAVGTPFPVRCQDGAFLPYRCSEWCFAWGDKVEFCASFKGHFPGMAVKKERGVPAFLPEKQKSYGSFRSSL